MDNVKRLSFHKLYLFENENHRKIYCNFLKEFISFLKFQGHISKIDFSYSGIEDSIHYKLSIKKNLILDSIPKSLVHNDESKINDYLEKIENPFLNKLIDFISPLDDKVCDLSAERLSLTTSIKALLANSKYVFLVQPDKNLSQKNIKILKQAIEFELKNNSRSFLIRPKNQDSWLDLATHFVTRNSDRTFSVDKNKLIGKKAATKFEPTYDFTLLKSS